MRSEETATVTPGIFPITDSYSSIVIMVSYSLHTPISSPVTTTESQSMPNI